MSKKKQILGTGLSGLVGSRIVELLSDKYAFHDLSLDTGIDIRDRKTIFKIIEKSNADILIHLAAKTDVDSCEEEKKLGKESQAWQINVIGTRNLADACKEFGKKMIYVSTDFVFDGKNGPYTEKDYPQPINFYGLTKYEGERIVQKLNEDYLIVRISYPYRSFFPKKTDVVRSLIKKLSNERKLAAIRDQLIVPTFIDDIAESIKILIGRNVRGIYHLVGSQALSPFDLATIINRMFNFNGEVRETTLSKYYRGRAKRPFKSVLKNDRMKALGARLLGVKEGLQRVKDQLRHNSKQNLSFC